MIRRKINREPAYDTEYIQCDCTCSIVAITRFLGGSDWQEITLSVYDKPGNSTFWWRIGKAWKVLRTGTPDTQCVLLDHDESVRLRDTLVAMIEDMEKEANDATN